MSIQTRKNAIPYLTMLRIDADFPIECDDEYWENDDPMLNFKQPEGRPSTMVCFNRMLLLGRIHGHALQTIVSDQRGSTCKRYLKI